MADNSYISKVNLPNNPTTYYIKDEEARDSLLQLQNEFVSKDGDTIDGTLNVTDVNAGTLLVTGNASFVNGLHGDLDGNATMATLAATATEANHAATATTATSATSAEKIRINNEDVSVGDYLTPAYFIDGVPIQTTGKTIPLINGTGTTTGTWLGSLTGLTAYYDGLVILYKIPIAGKNPTTLNINNLGAKTVYYNNASKVTTHFPVNQIIMLVYCESLNEIGGCWMCVDTYTVSNSDHYTTPWCNTGGGEAAKVASCSSYALRKDSLFPILIVNTNTANEKLTLNINSKGAKDIYINGAISSASNYTLPAGMYFIYYDGTNYYFRTDNTIDADISGNAATADSAITATKANKVIDSNNNSTEITITSSKTAQTTTSNLASWNGNEIGKILPETLKEVMSLDNVENKSSATIRGELTKKNVTDALGYTPPTEDTDTHYTTHIYAGNGTAANSTSDLTNPKIAVADNTTVAGTNGYIQLKGSGATTVTAKNGVVTIDSADTWTPMVGATASSDGNVGYINVVPPKDGYNTKYLRADGTWAVPPDVDTHYTAYLYAGTSTGSANKATQNGETYLILKDGSSVRSRRKIYGDGNIIEVTSNNSGDVYISALDTYLSTTSGGTVSGNLTVTGTITGSLSGNASTATKFNSDRTIELTGDVTGSANSDGESGWSIATTIANSSVTNGKLANDSITIAGNELELGQSLDAPTLVTSLGLSTAMHFIGRATVARDNANFPAITNYTPASGDVVLGLNDNIEYVYDGTSWLILGDESSYKVVQTAVSDPEPSGYSSTFISSISQNQDGVISVDKKNLPAILLSGDASGTGTVSNDATDVTISVSSVKATLLKPYSAANTTVATGHDNTGVNSNNGERVQNVWQQNFSDKRLKYTRSGTSTKSTITDTGYLMLFLTGNANANQAYLNMKIDGTYYGNFSGTLSGTIESFKTGQSVTETDSTNSGIGYVSVTAADWNNNKTTGAIYRHVKDSNNVHQIFGDYSTGQLAVRGKAAGTWSDWRVVLDSQNWSNYIDTSVNTTIYVGESAIASNSTTTNTNTYITIASNSSVATSNGSIKIQGDGDVSVTSDNAGTITVSCNDTHNTAYIYAGTSTGNVNATTTDGNTHIILKDGSSVSSRVKIIGDGATSVVSDANGTITISSTNTWTPMTGAKSSANGTVGYVNAIPPKNGYNTKYLRADGTWEVPPDTWNPLVGAQQNVDGTAGYVPQPLKGTDYNKKYLCSDGTWKKPSIGDLSGVPISIENGGTGESSALAAITSLGSIYIKAGGTQITSQKNLDTEFNTPGTYYSSQKSISENLLGTVPITGSGFKLYTIGGYIVNRPRQIIDVGGSNTALLQRTSTDGGSSWNKWHKFVFIPSGNDNKTFNDVGSSTQPVYVTSSGVVTAITGAIANDITGNAATATKFASAKTVELTGDVTGSASDDGTNGWSITTTANALTSLGRYAASLNDIDFSNGNYKGKITFLHADANTLYKPNYGTDGTGGGTNGSVINIGWDNLSTNTDNKYGAQIMLTNGTTTGSGTGATQMYIRGRHNNNNWDEWRKVLNSGNWSDYITISAIGLGVVSKTANGLVPQLPNETTTTKYLRQDGTWAIPDINELSNTPLSIDNGGTGASTAITAITNLSGLSTGTIGNDIEANKNLDTDFGTPGTYRSVDGTRTGTLSGSKPVTTGFKMYVTKEYSDARRKQIIQGVGATNLFQRYRTNNTTWGSWYRFIFAEGNSGVGSSTQPVYVNSSGVVTAITGDLANNITGNAATATKATQDGNGNVITSTYLPLSGGTLTGALYGDNINVNATKSKTTGGLGLYGNNSGLNYSIMMRGTDTAQDGLGTHGYVTGDWATYFNQAGISTHPDDRGWIFRSGLQSSEVLIPVASISGAGHAVFNGSVTVGGNAANTSGCRLEFDNNLSCLNFVFN